MATSTRLSLDCRATRLHLLAIALIVASLPAGCVSSRNKWVTLRATPRNPLSETLGLVARSGPKPTERTIQLLRRYNLEEDLTANRSELLARLNQIDQQEPRRVNAYALAELAYVGAKREEQSKNIDEALELYGSSVVHSYRYLFDERYADPSNKYDPKFRRACDLYNAALEGALRIVQTKGNLRPGTTQVIKTANHNCQLDILLKSQDWHEGDFDHFEFVSDYEVHGLRNHYHNFGLGVPLIAVHKRHDEEESHEEFYPADLSFPVTAFMRVKIDPNTNEATGHAVLELYDPLNQPRIQVAGAHVPLETDLSTPLAHTLAQPALDDNTLSTIGLLNTEKAKELRGLYMLEPYRPEKIPVVMVHGLWSSPVTWMEMFNDLRSDPLVRQNFQFWFYLYPTGQPFWMSAAEMREDLGRMRHVVDPQGRAPALDQMILVGHSMGGLVSKLQTVDSGNDFWNTLSERPFTEVEADEVLRAGLERTFFFDPNPSIRRVITLGTPHRGSDFANDTTRWLGRKIIKIPSMLMQGRHQLIARNPDFFRPDAPLNITTSIDALVPDSPLLPVLLTAQTGDWVRFHNVAGDVPKRGIKEWFSSERGDGVVTLASAQLENATSQIVVEADHSQVHRHPQSILEVRRILMQHLAELNTFPYNGGVQHASVTAPPAQPPVATAMQAPVATNTQ